MLGLSLNRRSLELLFTLTWIKDTVTVTDPFKLFLINLLEFQFIFILALISFPVSLSRLPLSCKAH